MSLIDFKLLLQVIYFIVPGFLIIEISRLFTIKSNRQHGEKEKFYTLLIFSLITYFIFFSYRYFSKWDKEFSFNLEKLYPGSIFWLFVIVVFLGIIWGLSKEKFFPWFFKKLISIKLSDYTGDESLWETTFREMLIEGKNRIIEVHLKEGIVYKGKLLYTSHEPYKESICIQPNRRWLEIINENLKDTQKKVFPYITSHEETIDIYKSILIDKSDILYLAFRRTPEELKVIRDTNHLPEFPGYSFEEKEK